MEPAAKSPPRSRRSRPKQKSGLTLTPAQNAALQSLTEFLQSPEKLYLLTGYAGTGKTTLLQVLIRQLQAQKDPRKIVLTAFSNKATKVLQSMAHRWHLDDIDCMTCCKLLGLRPVIDEQNGTQVFRPDPKQPSQIDRYGLVVVDECSMINAEMWELLVNAVSNLYGGTQLLFVGDPAQLPPVGETESRCFNQIHGRVDLTEVVRYGGAIAAIAADLRQNLERPQLPRFAEQANPDKTEGCFVFARRDWESLLIRAVQSPSYQADPDQVRALAYTNRRVAQLNRQIRATIYGDQAERFVPGERLIANNPCLEGESIILPTSAECEVLQVSTGRAGRWPVWLLEVETEEGKYRTLRVLHEDGQPEFDLKLNLLAREKRWMEFWDLKQLFHDVTYAYSLTIHKSQGSTFQDVFVDLPSMRVNRNVVERNQLCYVAFTRAAKRLFLYQ